MIDPGILELTKKLRKKHQIVEKRPKRGSADAKDPKKLRAYYELRQAYKTELRTELRKRWRARMRARLLGMAPAPAPKAPGTPTVGRRRRGNPD